eukprot:maker-scaffold59_size442576-snap-gene-0.20 protein:Tk11662 transcript:maker-scaffold59_size442576-snap-gene-0.20-mRNA-1 annotation:"PREDICTED: uncharacterized protein LOC100867326"
MGTEVNTATVMDFKEGLFSLSGFFKILETIVVFSALMVHRYGANGHLLFFGTSLDKLEAGDDALEIENAGNAVLVTYAIISPVLWLSYVIDGRYFIQGFILEPFWNFLGFCMFLGVGIKTLIVWVQAKAADTDITNDSYYSTYGSGLALGSLCIIASLLYFIDFWLSTSARGRVKNDPNYY